VSELLVDAKQTGKTVDLSNLLDPGQAAAFLHVTSGTLGVWRCTRRYPLRFVKVGRKVMYRTADLEAFLNERTMSGVAEQPASRSRARAR
jgi:hypothetical protein